MSTLLEEKIEKIEELLERLAIQSAKDIPIVVEGQKDVAVLRKLALDGHIIAAKTRKSFLALVTEIEKSNAEEVIVLMDFDRRGKEWTKRLSQYLEQTNVKCNTFFWQELRKLIGREVKDIEGMLPYLHTLKKKSINSQTIIESKH
ncbi:MAG: toprim domain-containing protein [Candidatus Bathyarchaeota archaeon]|nr:MAG: toprim domain-containing protein [Candidatus Bathyarchaeota archaeon]